MPDVVGSEVHFYPLGCEVPVGKAHDACVVDDDVDAGYVVPSEEVSGGGADGFLGGEVES